MLEFRWRLEFWFGFRLCIKLELLLGVFGLKVPLVLKFGLRVGLGLAYWLMLGFGQGQGERGGRVGVWSGVLSWVSPSKLETSAMRKSESEIMNH